MKPVCTAADKFIAAGQSLGRNTVAYHQKPMCEMRSSCSSVFSELALFGSPRFQYSAVTAKTPDADIDIRILLFI